jgi:glycosyltransferase involved in cell wall biosynthesis
MWTLNGAKTLEPVLERINRVIPVGCVGQRLIVDDGSTDETVKIAGACGWRVIRNEGKGISDGANTALKNVETEWFCSFEQDLLLASDWWLKVSAFMVEGVGCVQGMRFSSVDALSLMEQEHYKRFKTLYVSIDNNLFRKAAVEAVGGFPSGCPVCTDSILRNKMLLDGRFKWVILDNVLSTHIRGSLGYAVNHAYAQNRLCNRTHLCSSNLDASRFRMTRLFLTSPFRAVFLFANTKTPSVFLYYPYLRLRLLQSELVRGGKL